jgi:hypothetical protein
MKKKVIEMLKVELNKEKITKEQYDFMEMEILSGKKVKEMDMVVRKYFKKMYNRRYYVKKQERKAGEIILPSF